MAESAKAGGGASAKQRSVTVIDGHVLTHLRNIYNALASKNPENRWTSADVATFLKNVQRSDLTESDLAQAGGLDFNQFLDYMTSPHAKISKDPPPTDLNWPLSSYFISSSHNTYLSGNQLSSDSTTESYTNVLLRGCRCVEVDVWDGDDSDSELSSSDEEAAKSSSPRRKGSEKNGLGRYSSIKKRLPGSLSARLEKTSIGKRLEDRETRKGGVAAATGEPKNIESSDTMDGKVPEVALVEPRVLHGYTLTKEITFRDVCVAIRESAFKVTDTPLIVSLEVHCSPAQQAIMVSIMKETWGDYLVPEPESEPQMLPSPEQLRSKILVKVKYAAPGSSSGRSESPGDEDDDRLPADGNRKNKAPSKIIQDLSRLGVYTRGITFKDFTQPEAAMPTHIFSLSEKKFLDNHENRSVELWEHNKKYLMRTYPKGTRITSSNLNPAPFWGFGSQVVALNWQQVDEGMMLNEGMFAGTGGYVLKPEGYRQDLADRPQGPVTTKTLKSLSITFLAAQGIPLPPDDTSAKGFEPYIKVELHVDGSEGQRRGHIANGGHEREGEYKARTKTYKGVDIDLKGEVVKFPEITGLIEELTFVRFTVRDDEIGRDDLAAWCCVRLDRLGEGYRFVHLLDSNAELTDGVILVKVQKTMV